MNYLIFLALTGLSNGSFIVKINTASFLTILLSSTLLIACGQDNNRQQEIQPAKKLTNDASSVANEAWVLINQLDQILYAGEKENLDEVVRLPLRELSNRWKIEIKMTDSVTEGKYALCRKSLNSLDVWARSLKEGAKDIAHKQAEYERDKALCQDAIEHPELGNTPPR